MIIGSMVLTCVTRQNKSKIFYMLLSHEIGSTKCRNPPPTVLIWTCRGPRPLAYFTPPNSEALTQGAQSHPQHDAIPLCVV